MIMFALCSTPSWFDELSPLATGYPEPDYWVRIDRCLRSGTVLTDVRGGIRERVRARRLILEKRRQESPAVRCVHVEEHRERRVHDLYGIHAPAV